MSLYPWLRNEHGERKSAGDVDVQRYVPLLLTTHGANCTSRDASPEAAQAPRSSFHLSVTAEESLARFLSDFHLEPDKKIATALATRAPRRARPRRSHCPRRAAGEQRCAPQGPHAKSADSALLAREQETAARGERAAGASCKTAARKSYNLVKRKLNKTVRVARLREEEMLRDSASAPERSGPAAPAPELPVSPSKEATSGDTRPGAVEERPRAVSGAGPSADSRVSPAGKAQQGLTERYRVGSLLGRGGFGSVFAATRLSDGAPVAIKRVPRNRIRHWGELPNGTSAPHEVVLLDKVSTGFPGVVQLLEWLELPNNVVLVMERPEHSQDLLRFIRERGFLSEEVARELFRQVLEAVRHCTSCGVLHRDLKPENILVDLATGQAKLIDFGCGTHLQDTAYTRFAGTPSYSPPEWNHFGWYYGEAATVWSLGIVLHQMVCGQHPFPKGRNISWGQLSLPQRLSQDCKELIRWCLSLHSLDRPSLEDLSCDPWLQDIHHP
ncbi:serine/threonine-protein kinase pim-1-like [Corvus hawaiiensis]|uniref:serine/threonine-protein kinase pim-1-like n=1 Tax=Corvus hawaiiensis TaxID=134902 RepID=UPI002019E650|nr:serine/threonine-protein kinase pim-1-like [Corvus hawaiiensis]